jgi:hypothetical protein
MSNIFKELVEKKLLLFITGCKQCPYCQYISMEPNKAIYGCQNPNLVQRNRKICTDREMEKLDSIPSWCNLPTNEPIFESDEPIFESDEPISKEKKDIIVRCIPFIKKILDYSSAEDLWRDAESILEEIDRLNVLKK